MKLKSDPSLDDGGVGDVGDDRADGLVAEVRRVGLARLHRQREERRRIRPGRRRSSRSGLRCRRRRCVVGGTVVRRLREVMNE